MKALACALLAFLGALPAVAMEFHAVGHTLVMAGAVDGGDLARLRDHLASGKFTLVVLHESPGGDLFNGYQLAHRIRSEGLDTAVSGRCESACGLIFLGGVRRSYSDGMDIDRTMVGLHGAYHHETRDPLPELSPRMAYVIRTMTDGKYPADLLQRTVYPKNAFDLVYAFHPKRFPSGPTRGVMECLKQPDAAFACSMLGGLDALGIGVATDPEILALDAQTKALLASLPSQP